MNLIDSLILKTSNLTLFQHTILILILSIIFFVIVSLVIRDVEISILISSLFVLLMGFLFINEDSVTHSIYLKYYEKYKTEFVEIGIYDLIPTEEYLYIQTFNDYKNTMQINYMDENIKKKYKFYEFTDNNIEEIDDIDLSKDIGNNFFGSFSDFKKEINKTIIIKDGQKKLIIKELKTRMKNIDEIFPIDKYQRLMIYEIHI